MNNNKILYDEITLICYDHLLAYVNHHLKGDWIFRAQPREVNLTSTLERECAKSDPEMLKYANIVEQHMIRQFRRVYDGNDKRKVEEDTLYCLSL